MTENPTGPQPRLVLEIELPGVYTADLEDAIGWDLDTRHEDAEPDELDLLLSALRVADKVAVRLFVEGEKDAEMVSVKGVIVGGRLDPPRDFPKGTA